MSIETEAHGSTPFLTTKDSYATAGGTASIVPPAFVTQIVNAIAHELQCSPMTLMEADSFERLKLDSLDTQRVACAVEDSLLASLPDDLIAGWTSITDILCSLHLKGFAQ